MKIVQIISEHKKKHIGIRYKESKIPTVPYPIPRGYKRVEAIVERNGIKRTEHLDILKNYNNAL